jgi:hypothetical protein
MKAFTGYRSQARSYRARLARRGKEVEYTLTKMRNGAELNLCYGAGPRMLWRCDGEFISSEVAHEIVKNPRVTANDDALFPEEVPSQTYKWV